MKDLIIAKQKELIELLDRYFLSKTRPSLDELIECADLKSELTELEQETTEDELYKKIYIKSEVDLPRKEGIYKTRFGELLFKNRLWKLPDSYKTYFDFTDFKVDWYLLALEQESKEDYPVYDENYLNECIKKATPGLSNIKDIDKALDEIRNVSKISKGSKSSRNNKSKEGQRGLSKNGKHAILHGKHFKK